MSSLWAVVMLSIEALGEVQHRTWHETDPYTLTFWLWTLICKTGRLGVETPPQTRCLERGSTPLVHADRLSGQQPARMPTVSMVHFHFPFHPTNRSPQPSSPRTSDRFRCVNLIFPLSFLINFLPNLGYPLIIVHIYNFIRVEKFWCDFILPIVFYCYIKNFKKNFYKEDFFLIIGYPER